MPPENKEDKDGIFSCCLGSREDNSDSEFEESETNFV